MCIYIIYDSIYYMTFFSIYLPCLWKKQTFNSLESVTCLDSPILGEVGPSNFGLTWLIILQLFKAGNGTKWFETTNRTSWSLLAALSMPPNTNFGLITKIWMQIPSNTQKQNHTAARQRIPSSSSNTLKISTGVRRKRDLFQPHIKESQVTSYIYVLRTEQRKIIHLVNTNALSTMAQNIIKYFSPRCTTHKYSMDNYLFFNFIWLELVSQTSHKHRNVTAGEFRLRLTKR